MDKSLEIQLIEQALSGDLESFGKLCSNYYSSMLAIAYSVLTDHHLAEDAAQEAFARALRNLNKLKSKEKFAFWLARICRNVAKDMTRSRSRLKNSEDLSQLPASPDKDCNHQAVNDALNSLSAPDRELIALRYYDNLPYEKIADVLRLSKPAINGRLHRARKKMAKYLQKSGFPEVRL